MQRYKNSYPLAGFASFETSSMIPTSEEFNPLLKHFLQLNGASFPTNKATVQALYLSGQQLYPHLINLLPQQQLSQIWALSDINQDGKLYFNQFAVLMKIIKLAKQGQPIPTQIPPDVIAFMKAGYTELAMMQPLQTQPTGLFKPQTQPQQQFNSPMPQMPLQYQRTGSVVSSSSQAPQPSYQQPNYSNLSMEDIPSAFDQRPQQQQPPAPQISNKFPDLSPPQQQQFTSQNEKISAVERAQVAVQQAQLQTDQSNLSQMSQQFSQLQSEFSQINTQKVNLDLQIKSTQEAIAKMRQDIQQITVNINQETNTITVLERQVSEIQSEYTAVTTEKSKLMYDVGLLKDRKQQLNTEYNEKNEQIAYMLNDKNKLLQEQQQLQQETKQLEADIKKLNEDPFDKPQAPIVNKIATLAPNAAPMRTVSLPTSPPNQLQNDQKSTASLSPVSNKQDFSKKFPDLEEMDPFAQEKEISKNDDFDDFFGASPKKVQIIEKNTGDDLDDFFGSSPKSQAMQPPQNQPISSNPTNPSNSGKPSFNDFDSFFSQPISNKQPQAQPPQDVSPNKAIDLFNTDFSFDAKFQEPKKQTHATTNSNDGMSKEQQDKLKKLVDMGFEKNKAVSVLKETNWNLESAIEKLF